MWPVTTALSITDPEGSIKRKKEYIFRTFLKALDALSQRVEMVSSTMIPKSGHRRITWRTSFT